MSQPKVVPIEVKPKLAASHASIATCVRKETSQQLEQLLTGLFDCTDDALFELADRSSTDTDHHLYFHSMRQIRLQRSEIEQRFLSSVFADFDRLFHPQPSPDASVAINVDEMTLLQGDELEVNVAVSGIVSKVTTQFSLPIMELTKRLNALCASATVTERLNPLGPQRICDAFVFGIEPLDVDIRIRLILLKLYERLVMQNILGVYHHANELLIKAGVLPELKRRRDPARAQPNRPAGSADQPASPASNGTSDHRGARGAGGQTDVGALSYGAHASFDSPSFGFIQNLLAAARSEPADVEDSGHPVLATPQLIHLLNAAQQEAQRQAGTEYAAETPLLANLHQLIAARAPDVTGSAISQLRRADEDVVHFIGMLFDYILNDRNLAIPMKALISRLQIPIVKLAIIDKSFFEKSAHPARVLLNELSSAGIGWSSAAELKRDNVYDMIESVVARVLNDFSENPDVFIDLLEELRSFRIRDEQRNQLLETRVKQTEAGRARTLAAKQIAQQLINQKASGLRLPPAAGRFISEIWSRVLIYACVKNGTHSTEWHTLTQILDDLLWSLQPLQRLEEIQRREAMAEALIGQVAGGIELIQLGERGANQWLATLQTQLADISESDRAYLDEARSLDNGSPALSANDYTAMVEIVLAPPEELADPYSGDAPAAPFLAAIDQLQKGTWVEIDQQGTDPLRCKLTTVIHPGARYVFVNRRGMKVAERSRMELATQLQDGCMRILNDTQVFDRALQSVIGNLRQMQARPSA